MLNLLCNTVDRVKGCISFYLTNLTIFMSLILYSLLLLHFIREAAKKYFFSFSFWRKNFNLLLRALTWNFWRAVYMIWWVCQQFCRRVTFSLSHAVYTREINFFLSSLNALPFFYLNSFLSFALTIFSCINML